MKLLLKYIIALAGLLPAAVSCGLVAEDTRGCDPPANARITFNYTGDTNDPSLLGIMIDRIDLLIYDGNGDWLASRFVDNEEIVTKRETEFYLVPGRYHIVCWGNVFDQTEIPGHGTLGQGRIHHPEFAKRGVIPTNNHLYYGACDILVDESGTAVGEVNFQSSHINMRVYVDTPTPAASPDNFPKIEAHNLMPQYDMEMNPVQPFATTYHAPVAYNSARGVNESYFQVLRFMDDNTIKIEIKEPSGETKYTVDLKQYMLDNNLSVDGKHEATIPILVQFTSIGVQVRVPEWEIHNVDPGT